MVECQGRGRKSGSLYSLHAELQQFTQFAGSGITTQKDSFDTTLPILISHSVRVSGPAEGQQSLTLVCNLHYLFLGKLNFYFLEKYWPRPTVTGFPVRLFLRQPAREHSHKLEMAKPQDISESHGASYSKDSCVRSKLQAF